VTSPLAALVGAPPVPPTRPPTPRLDDRRDAVARPFARDWFDARRHLMSRSVSWIAALALTLSVVVGLPAQARAQAPIEGELALITPVSKFIHDAALKAFADYAKEKWNLTLKVSAIPAGTPVAYGRIVEWKGKPEADIFWGGESALFEKLAEQKLLQKVEIAREAWDSIPAAIGKPRPIPLKDKDGYWVGTALEPYGLVYNPKKIQRLGVAALQGWDDLLNPKLKGEVAQCAPTRSSSSNATYEVILSLHGEDKGWEWLKALAANTGLFTARSRDVPTVVAKGEFAAGFAVPSYMAFEEKLAGFDIKFVAPKYAFVTPEPMAILAGARNPKAARAFIEFLLTERGQKVFMERGLFPITPRFKVQGPPGSTAEMAVDFTGGVRSYFDAEILNVYDEPVAARRSEALKTRFRSDIEATWKKP
jgi:iron(III) transport system substrate-binding protein